jgi:16S rRNA (uracil1498-N3)-methyltransferase
MATLPRLYVDHPLATGQRVHLEPAQAHYIRTVLRLGCGASIELFNGCDGAWLGTVEPQGKRDAEVVCQQQNAPQEAAADVWLLAATLKRGRIDWVAEKACELGVARLLLVQTRRAVVDRPNLARLRAHMIEAAEQCGRTSVPELVSARALFDVLAEWPSERRLLFCDETGGAPALKALRERGPWAVLIGPEGGFDPIERERILSCPQAVGVSLGPRILRADTAAVAALSIMQATIGDWN